MQLIRYLVAAIVVVLVSETAGLAQKPPGLGYAFPPVVEIGNSTDVQFGGFDFTPDMQWFVHDERVKFEVLGPPGDYHLPPPPYWFGPRAITSAPHVPREVPGRVAVAGEASERLVRWQVANANGSSGTAMLLLSRGREIIESRSRDLPQRIDTLPVGVSGRLGRFTEVDRYEFVADRHGLVTVEQWARRLGADFNGVIAARDAKGTLLADYSDTPGKDGAITFAVRKGESYTVSLHDADFRGDRAYVYRLAMRYGPRVLCTIPAQVRRGASQEVEFVGIGVASGNPQVESLRSRIETPSDAGSTTFTHRLQTAGGEVDVIIPLTDWDEISRETITASKEAATQPLPAPIGITGRIAASEPEHRYVWRAEKGEHWSIDAASRAIGGSLDVAISVLDPEGKPVAENDDVGVSTDATVKFQAAAAGNYTCVVRAMSSLTDAADEIYRLEIARSDANFVLTVPQRINLPAGGKVDMSVVASRVGGFDGPISLVIDGLPAGITTEGELNIAAGKNEATIKLLADADAAVVASPLSIHGTAMIGEQSVQHVAVSEATGNLAPRSAGDLQCERVLFAMTMTPPFELKLVDGERQRDVPRGTTYRAEFEVVRKDGFAGELRVEMAAQQDRQRQGVRGPIVLVPANVNRVEYPCFMPEWLSTDLTRRLVVHGVAIVPDAKGNLRHVLSPAVGRITMIMEGALLKLTAEAKELVAKPGDTIDVPVSIARSAKLPAEAVIELVVPEELSGGISAEPLRINPDQGRGTIRVTTKADSRLTGDWPLTIKATAFEDGKWPVVSQTEIVVRFRDDTNPQAQTQSRSQRQ
jgi:hypothetical protein